MIAKIRDIWRQQNERKCWLAPNPAFDGPVILFENILEVLHRSVPAIYLQTVRWSAQGPFGQHLLHITIRKRQAQNTSRPQAGSPPVHIGAT
jgi:hypothetical protein